MISERWGRGAGVVLRLLSLLEGGLRVSIYERTDTVLVCGLCEELRMGAGLDLTAFGDVVPSLRLAKLSSDMLRRDRSASYGTKPR